MDGQQTTLAEVAAAVAGHVQEINGALADGRFHDAEAAGDQILRSLQPLLGVDLPREARFALVMAHYARGLAARERCEYEHAAAAFEKAVEVADASNDLTDDLKIHVLNHFAITYDRMGDPNRSAQLYERITGLIHPSRKV